MSIPRPVDYRATSRVVITGIGISGPFGPGSDVNWQCLLRGDRAIRELSADDISHFDALCDALKMVPRGASLPTRSQDPLLQITESVVEEAVHQAGLDQNAPRDAGIVFGASKGSMRAMQQLGRLFQNVGSGKGPSEDRRFDATGQVFNDQLTSSPLSSLLRRYPMFHRAMCPVAACATGTVAMLTAFDWIRSGRSSLCVAGSADASLTPAVLGSFRRLGVLSRYPDAAVCCRPFAEHRDGFAVGEGGAAFVLEREDRALARGARPLAVVEAAEAITDPAGMTQVDTSGAEVSRLLQSLTSRSGQPDAVFLHGTGTEANDLAEARGVSDCFGPRSVPCVATKGQTGHLLGGAGSFELATAVLSLIHGRLPPTAAAGIPDPACPVTLTSRDHESVRPKRLFKLSLGFGGHVVGVSLHLP